MLYTNIINVNLIEQYCLIFRVLTKQTLLINMIKDNIAKINKHYASLKTYSSLSK